MQFLNIRKNKTQTSLSQCKIVFVKSLTVINHSFWRIKIKFTDETQAWFPLDLLNQEMAPIRQCRTKSKLTHTTIQSQEQMKNDICIVK